MAALPTMSWLASVLVLYPHFSSLHTGHVLDPNLLRLGVILARPAYNLLGIFAHRCKNVCTVMYHIHK